VTLLALLLLATPPGWAEADELAARARSLEGEAQRRAVSEAMKAYDALLKEHEKDRKLLPRLRRRRASRLKRVGRVRDARAEHDAIVAGRARRSDKARALVDGARLLEDKEAAVARLGEAIRRYPDVARMRAKAARLRGGLLEELGRPDEAEKSYRIVVEKCRFEEKEAIAAFDALALLELERGRIRHARRWIKRCFDTYEKRAARGDRKGAFLARRLGAMKAPAALAEALRVAE